MEVQGGVGGAGAGAGEEVQGEVDLSTCPCAAVRAAVLLQCLVQGAMMLRYYAKSA